MLWLRGLILTLIVTYPFYYAIPVVDTNFGHFFEILYFAFVDFLILIYLCCYFNKFRMAGLGIFITFIIWIWQFNGVDNVRPYFFLLTLLLLSFFSVQDKTDNDYKVLKFYPLFFIVVSCISIFFHSSYIDDGARFKGFSLSPTHYSVYALCGVVFAFEFIKNNITKVCCIIILSFFIFYSETRLALVVLLGIISLYCFSKITMKLKKVISFCIIIFFSLSYIAYALIAKYTTIFSGRYEGGDDKSYEARTLIQEHIFDALNNSSLTQYIFGHGAESARNMLIDIYGYDIMPHNDFVKLFYDFGAIGAIVFLICLYRYGYRNLLSLSLLSIYISAFYHNMAYSLFVVALLITLSTTYTQKLKNKY